jgi:hypothetical protein
MLRDAFRCENMEKMGGGGKEMSRAARKGWKWGSGGVVASCQKMAEMRGGNGLPRVAVSCKRLVCASVRVFIFCMRAIEAMQMN